MNELSVLKLFKLSNGDLLMDEITSNFIKGHAIKRGGVKGRP